MSRGLRGLMTLIIIVAMGVVYSIPSSANHPGPASGLGVAPQFTEGNPTCAQFFPGTEEFKLEPVGDGTFTHPGGTLTVTIDVRNSLQGQVFDFLATGGSVLGVVVKGGPNANLYDYEDHFGHGVSGKNIGDWTDTDLHAPVNHGNNRFYGLSHLSFCYLPVVPDILRIQKVDNSSPPQTLGGATFQLWRESNGTAGWQDTGTSDTLVDTCDDATDPVVDDGICDFTIATSGTYYVVETVAPPGYQIPTNPVVTTTIVVDDAVEDTHTFTVTNQPTPGRINITKTDDTDAPLNGAEFTLYTSDGDADFEPGAGDTAVATCTTGVENSDGSTPAAGACSFIDVAIGEYWVDETDVPSSHQKATGVPVMVTIDTTSGGDVENLGPFENPRLFKKIVLVCFDDELYEVTYAEDQNGDNDTDDPGETVLAPADGSQYGISDEAAFCSGPGLSDNLAGDHEIEVSIE